jgi:hypothetical protein
MLVGHPAKKISGAKRIGRTTWGYLLKGTAIESVVGPVLHGAVHLDPTQIVLSECRHPRTRKSGSRVTHCQSARKKDPGSACKKDPSAGVGSGLFR